MSDGQQGDMATANSSPSEISTSDGSSYSDGSYELTLTTITSPTVEPECSTTFVQSPEPQTLWRPIDDFCLIASVMHYCDIEFVYRFTRLGRSFTLEEVQSRWEELFADGSVLEQRREEITKLSDDQIFPELLRLQMNPVEVCALAEVPSTTTADVEFFRNLQAKKSKVFHELREPARLLEFWTDLRKANLLCDQKINPAPTGNVVLSLSDCSDEQSDQSSDSSTSKDSSSSEGSFEEDDFYKLSRLQKTVVALKQEINIIKEHIRGLVTALELAPETEGWTDSMAASSVVLHVGMRTYHLRSSLVTIGTPLPDRPVDIDLSPLIAAEYQHQSVGLLAEIEKRASSIYSLTNCSHMPIFVNGNALLFSKTVALIDQSVIWMAGIVTRFELNGCAVC